MTDPARYRAVGEAGWRWVLGQVDRDDDGPWIPEAPGTPLDPAGRHGLHSGTAGLLHALAAVALGRPWTAEESALADAVAEQLVRRAATAEDASFFDGLASDVGALVAVGRSPAPALARLHALAGADGWPQQMVGPPTVARGTPFLDLTLGAAGVLLTAVLAGDDLLAERAAAVLTATAEPRDAGVSWQMVADEKRLVPRRAEMPNLSHGTAGAATALAVAGAHLGRQDLVDLARRGAEHLVALRDPGVAGFAVPHLVAVPGVDAADLDDGEPLRWGWCHGPTGTSLLFLALHRAGVPEVAGRPPAAWHAGCLEAVRRSGVPERLRPGFWDNDGRCCGTAGVADAFLDSWQRGGDERDLAFAVRLGDALVERAVVEDDRACWRFVEHRAADPLLPPGVGWMQGAAGIAAYLLRLAAVLEGGRRTPAPRRAEAWWALPDGLSRPRPPG